MRRVLILLFVLAVVYAKLDFSTPRIIPREPSPRLFSTSFNLRGSLIINTANVDHSERPPRRGLAIASTFEHIENAISTLGEIHIDLAPGTVITFPHELVIPVAARVFFHGCRQTEPSSLLNPTVFDGNSTSRLFVIPASAFVDFTCIHFRNGSSLTSGGCLSVPPSQNAFSAATLVVRSCEFSNCHALHNGGAIDFSGAPGSELDIFHSSFHHNSGGDGGGSLFFTARTSSRVMIMQGSFSLNTAGEKGGAVLFFTDQFYQASPDRIEDFLIMLDGTSFIENHAELCGGALAVDHSLKVSLYKQASFIDNSIGSSSPTCGSAIALLGSTTQLRFDKEQVSFGSQTWTSANVIDTTGNTDFALPPLTSSPSPAPPVLVPPPVKKDDEEDPHFDQTIVGTIAGLSTVFVFGGLLTCIYVPLKSSEKNYNVRVFHFLTKESVTGLSSFYSDDGEGRSLKSIASVASLQTIARRKRKRSKQYSCSICMSNGVLALEDQDSNKRLNVSPTHHDYGARSSVGSRNSCGTLRITRDLAVDVTFSEDTNVDKRRAKQGSKFVRVKCKHVFHDHCIIEWCKTHATCPVCRQPVAEEHDAINDDERLVGHQNRIAKELEVENEYLFG